MAQLRKALKQLRPCSLFSAHQASTSIWPQEAREVFRSPSHCWKAVAYLICSVAKRRMPGVMWLRSARARSRGRTRQVAKSLIVFACSGSAMSADDRAASAGRSRCTCRRRAGPRLSSGVLPGERLTARAGARGRRRGSAVSARGRAAAVAQRRFPADRGAGPARHPGQDTALDQLHWQRTTSPGGLAPRQSGVPPPQVRSPGTERPSAAWEYRASVVPRAGSRPASRPLPPRWVRPACFVGSPRPNLVIVTITAQWSPLPAGIDSRGLESLHGSNAHKYVARSPAIHLNVPPVTVPGGWVNGHVDIDDDLRTEK